METEARRRFIINFFYFAILLGIAIFLCRYAFGTILPFLVALAVSLLLRPAVSFLRDKCRIHKGVAGIVLVVLFYTLIAFLLTILGIRLFAVCKAFFLRLPLMYTGTFEPWLNGLLDSAETFAEKLDPRAAAAYDVVSSNITKTLGTTVGALSQKAVGFATNFTIRTPRFLLNVLITIIATVFLSIDLPVLKEFVLRQCSEKQRSLLTSVRSHLGLTLGSYIRSYALIMFITFCELMLGLLIIGVKSPALVAVLIAVFDILPVVGSGTVLIPWALISVIQSDYRRAIGLGVVYLVIVIVRNIIEPKIVGNRVGMHPLVTLASMIVGVYVFGPVGLLGLPVTLALLVSLNEAGVIHLYKVKPADTASADTAATPPKKKPRLFGKKPPDRSDG